MFEKIGSLNLFFSMPSIILNRFVVIVREINTSLRIAMYKFALSNTRFLCVLKKEKFLQLNSNFKIKAINSDQ